MIPRLTVVNAPGNYVGKKLEIQNASTAVIGSAEQAALRLDTEAILPLHCAVSRLGNECVLAQLSPLAEVRINRQPVRWATLKDGDLIDIGPVELIFRNAASDIKLTAVKPKIAENTAQITPATAPPSAGSHDTNSPEPRDETERFRDIRSSSCKEQSEIVFVEDKASQTCKPLKATEPQNEPQKKAADRNRVKLVTVKCDSCRAVFREMRWIAGDACPRCGSMRFYPAVQVMTDDAYESADRSKGPSAWDMRFLNAAKWCGAIREAEAVRALRLQEKAAEKGWVVFPADKILLNRRVITEKQVSAVKEVLHFHSKKLGNVEKDENDLMQIAIATGNIEAKQAEFLKHAQAEMNVINNGHVPLCFVMIEKGVLPEKRVLVLLHRQRTAQRGFLHDLHEALRLMEKA